MIEGFEVSDIRHFDVSMMHESIEKNARELRAMMMIDPNSHAHMRNSWGGEGKYEDFLKGRGECRLCGNGAAQSATSCILCKRG